VVAKRKNITEIALQLGLSTATVSRVLNNKPDVNNETREKVLGFLQEVKYAPRTSVRTSPATKNRLIAFVNDFDRYPLAIYYVGGVLDGINHAVFDNGFYSVLISAQTVEKELRWPGTYPVFHQLAGVVWSMPIFEQRHSDFISKLGVPCVVVNNLGKGVPMHLIEVDNFTSVRQAVEYFASLGHRKIGFVGGDMDVANIRDRYSAYLQTMKTLELEIDRDWIIDDLSENTVAGATEGAFRLLGRKNLPTAVIACNDPVSIALYQVAHERGLRIPEDVSIISFDNDPETQFLTPPLTTFKQPFAEITGHR